MERYLKRSADVQRTPVSPSSHPSPQVVLHVHLLFCCIASSTQHLFSSVSKRGTEEEQRKSEAITILFETM